MWQQQWANSLNFWNTLFLISGINYLRILQIQIHCQLWIIYFMGKLNLGIKWNVNTILICILWFYVILSSSSFLKVFVHITDIFVRQRRRLKRWEMKTRQAKGKWMTHGKWNQVRQKRKDVSGKTPHFYTECACLKDNRATHILSIFEQLDVHDRLTPHTPT